MLGTRDEDNSLQAVQLTIDLKPDIPGFLLCLSLLIEIFLKKSRQLPLGYRTNVGRLYSGFCWHYD